MMLLMNLLHLMTFLVLQREALTNGAYDAAHKFASSYDFSSHAESEDNDMPQNM
jgi:hypothetical protein